MRGGGSWKGQPEVVGAWLPESPPPSPIPPDLSWKRSPLMGRVLSNVKLAECK